MKLKGEKNPEMIFVEAEQYIVKFMSIIFGIISGVILIVGLGIGINRIDQVTFESEQEIANGAEAVDAEIVLQNWRKNMIGPVNRVGRTVRICSVVLNRYKMF